jgi:hypothetical protein
MQTWSTDRQTERLKSETGHRKGSRQMNYRLENALLMGQAFNGLLFSILNVSSTSPCYKTLALALLSYTCSLEWVPSKTADHWVKVSCSKKAHINQSLQQDKPEDCL